MQRITTHAMAVWLGLAAIVIAGCDSTSSADGSGYDGSDSSGNESSTDSGVTDPGDFTFPEDAEPAVADLPFVEDELITQTMPGADEDCVHAVFAQTGTTVLDSLAEIQTMVLRVEPDELVAAAAELAASPLIESVHKNYLYEATQTPDDPKFASQGYLEGIGLPQAWDTTTGSTDVIIAVLDAGVAGDHPDLNSKLLEGWNTFNNNSDTADVAGHGTSVAGVAAAAGNNAIGVAGISWASPIMPVRVTNTSGQASAQAIAAGIIWAANHGAKVINVSFAPLQSDETVLRAARYARSSGALVFVSAGNDGQSSTAGSNANAIFVGATNSSSQLASFSSTGPFVDLVAPGVGIWTTAHHGDYHAVSGTSFASPIAAGVAALIWSVRPELRPATVDQLLANTALDLGPPGRDDSFGAGLIDAAAAVTEAQRVSEQDDRTAPLVDITAPADGQSVSGVVTVNVWAADAAGGIGVADVVLSLDGQPIATDADQPFRFAIDTGLLLKGTHTLTCVATDAAGNPSAPVSIQIVGGEEEQDVGCTGVEGDLIWPEVFFNFPVEGATVTGSVGIQATATDNLGLVQAAWLVDGVAVQSSAIDGVRAVAGFVWDATTYAQGTHTVTIRITDEAGNVSSADLTLIKH